MPSNTNLAHDRNSAQGSNDAFSLTDREFKKVCDVIRELTGISMGEAKRELVYRRVSSRLKALNMTSVPKYLAILESGDAEEIQQFNNAVTTNLTSFFREQHHFDFLKSQIMPDLMKKKARTNRRIRMWSAGCSTGEEPYSIAMTIHESTMDLASWDFKLLCTDLDSNVLAKAKAGTYRTDRIEKISEKQLNRWFDRADNTVTAREDLKRMMVFNQLNLMGQWPMKGKFDVIFCRNVVIYFDKPTQRVLMDRYADQLEDDAYLILGHSESLTNVSDRFELIGQTIYKKIK